MTQYNVTGMSCAACSARVEKAVSKLEGVTACSVSLLTNSMGVEGSASADEIIAAVTAAGYGASLKNADKTSAKPNDDILKDTETPKILKRLIASLVFLCALMYISMGHMMWGWPLPPFFEDNHVAMGLAQLILAAVVMVINQKFFISGFKGLINRAPNMDTLVALGSGTAFVYSTAALFLMTDAQLRGDSAAVMSYMHEFYFESAAMILVLITVGKMLEARSKGKTTDALKGLISLAPKTATLVVDGKEQVVPAEQIKIADIFAVRPGESIPVDGVVIEGSGAVNESALTGESVPADKTEGSTVSAATVNQSGFLLCRAVRVGEDTTLAQIIKTVSDAAATKAPIAKIADKVSGVFVPAVLAIAAVTIAVWLLVGQSVGFALARGISVLVISCPCALGLATPVAIMVGSGVGAKNGILYKTAVSLETAGKISTVVLDKTGTVTEGKPAVTDILPANGVSKDELLRLAYSLEQKSEHPLARAIVSECESYAMAAEAAGDFSAIPGKGLCGTLRGKKIYGGNYSYISSLAPVDGGTRAKAEALAENGKTPLYFCLEGKLLGVIAVADVIKAESPQAIERLKNMGIRVVMLTGDNPKTAAAIAKSAGIDEVKAGVLPTDKAEIVTALKSEGRVAMVGDGINDAPALTAADLGAAIGAGTDIAIDAADVVLVKSRLSDVPAMIALGRSVLRNIHENLFWAFIYNVIGIPLAAGVFINLFGWQLNPMFGAAAMSLSSFCVVTNALRLNLVKIYSARHDRKIHHRNNKSKTNPKINTAKEQTTMEKVIKVEGMMCPHCEAAVKKALEAVDGIESVLASHEKGTAVVTLAKPVDDETLKKAVENAGYKVL